MYLKRYQPMLPIHEELGSCRFAPSKRFTQRTRRCRRGRRERPKPLAFSASSAASPRPLRETLRSRPQRLRDRDIHTNDTAIASGAGEPRAAGVGSAFRSAVRRLLCSRFLSVIPVVQPRVSACESSNRARRAE